MVPGIRLSGSSTKGFYNTAILNSASEDVSQKTDKLVAKVETLCSTLTIDSTTAAQHQQLAKRIVRSVNIFLKA